MDQKKCTTFTMSSGISQQMKTTFCESRTFFFGPPCIWPMYMVYGTGVISGIGERLDHFTVSVELASSHVPWDNKHVYTKPVERILGLPYRPEHSPRRLLFFCGSQFLVSEADSNRSLLDSIRSLPDSIRGLLCYIEVTIRAYSRIVAYSN